MSSIEELINQFNELEWLLNYLRKLINTVKTISKKEKERISNEIKVIKLFFQCCGCGSQVLSSGDNNEIRCYNCKYSGTKNNFSKARLNTDPILIAPIRTILDRYEGIE